MRMTYKVLRNAENKIIDRFFIIEKSNNTPAEYEKMEKVYKSLTKKYLVGGDYGVLSISYSDNKEQGRINETVGEFTANVKQLYKDAKNADALHVSKEKTAVNKTGYNSKNNAKKVRRRARGIVKALQCYGGALIPSELYDYCIINSVCMVSRSRTFARYRKAIKRPGKSNRYKACFTPYFKHTA